MILLTIFLFLFSSSLYASECVTINTVEVGLKSTIVTFSVEDNDGEVNNSSVTILNDSISNGEVDNDSAMIFDVNYFVYEKASIFWKRPYRKSILQNIEGTIQDKETE